jgi:predicted nucleic acid-binding protein
MLSMITMGALLLGIGALSIHSNTLEGNKINYEPSDEIEDEFTSKEAWLKEMEYWTEEKVNQKIISMNAEYYHFNYDQAKNYIAEQESRMHHSALFADIF